MNDLFGENNFEQHFEVNRYVVAGVEVQIREFSFHRFNANQVWPGNQVFAEFLVKNIDFLRTRKIIELGAGSGILSIFLAKIGVRATVSDCPDEEVFENIDENCRLNNVDMLDKFPRIFYVDLWGDPIEKSDFDLIIASDILLYIKEFPKLIVTVNSLIGNHGLLWLNNRRRIDTEQVFLAMCKNDGFSVTEIAPKIFEIKKTT